MIKNSDLWIKVNYYINLKKKKPGNNKLATYCPTTTKYTND